MEVAGVPMLSNAAADTERRETTLLDSMIFRLL
jgi:hypothetical protein